jgi:dTDP-N-acetylfucosamine:lipid II N-acetylfucosaminyltransferase
LSSVDVGLFNHDRQQALGNIFSLLYFGKKVYIKNDITTWDFLTSKGITVYNIYDLDKLNLEELIYIEDSLKEKNRENLQKEFSIEKGIELWGKIFCS